MSLPESNDPLSPPKACCVQLRSKSMYYRADERPGMIHDENAMGYWCQKTNDNCGPDGRSVFHERCQPERGCYEPGPEKL